MLKILLTIFLLITPVLSFNDTQLLDNLLSSNHFKYTPEIEVFDCVDMSTANYNFLKSHGYEVLLALRQDPDTQHAYVLVNLSSGWVGVETRSIDTSKRIGIIIKSILCFQICKTPDEVYNYDILWPHPHSNESVIEVNVCST